MIYGPGLSSQHHRAFHVTSIELRDNLNNEIGLHVRHFQQRAWSLARISVPVEEGPRSLSRLSPGNG
jgi:hypothetical protein